MTDLKKIKKFLEKKKICACLISKNNQFLNEIVNPKENLLLKVTNFTGSNGYALIFTNKQYLYVDGRYHQQAKIQSNNFIIKDILKLKKDLSKISKGEANLLIDPKTFSLSFSDTYKFKNLVFFNSIKKKYNQGKIINLSKNYSGEETIQKIRRLKSKIPLKNNEAFLITSPENIGWLSNIRVIKNSFNKILKCIAIFNKNRIYIFTDSLIKSKINNVIFKKSSELANYISKFKKIYLDKNYTNIFYFNKILKENINIDYIKDPIDNLKSIKNSTEISNFKIAHMFDGIAYIKFFFWLKNNTFKKISERDCQKKIEFFKKKNKFYLGPSFETIAATEKNASIIHYNPKDYRKTYLKKNDLFLFDSGSQYMFGTTDMTRTISLGKQSFQRRKIYTLVLKSHIAVSTTSIKKFTTGKIVDHIARKILSKYNYDYNHSTGHGVGYLSNVHETPPALSKFDNKIIYPNQVTSNEPGFYKNGDFGIRLENLVFVNNKGKFENLTLVPFENSMIISSMLNKNEKKWINNYHDNVYEKIYKFLNTNERKFLKKCCLKID